MTTATQKMKGEKMTSDELFGSDNTTGYTDSERNALNMEWAGIVEEFDLETGSDEYYIRQKQFCDEVSRRT